MAVQALLPASQDMRRRVLDVASRVLTERGMAALTVRSVAVAAGCSTMMIYTLFGGKDALIESLYRDGFERLQAAQARVDEREPVERLRRLAHAYRSFGLDHRSLYAAMFSRPLAPARLQATSVRLEEASYGTLLRAVRAAVDSGAISEGRAPQMVADAFWSAVHGHVSLEITGHFDDDRATANERFEALVDMCLTGLCRRPPKEREG